MERAGEAEGQEDGGEHQKGQKAKGLRHLSSEGEGAHVHREKLEETDGQAYPYLVWSGRPPGESNP